MTHGSFPNPALSGALLGTPELQLFASRDLEQTRAMVAQVMKPHELHVHGAGQHVKARMHHAAFGGVSLNRLAYGAEVEIEPGSLDDFYLVQMPLAGHASITSGSQQIDSGLQLASVISPDDATVMRWSGDCDQLMVRIERQLIERALRAQTGNLEAATLRFQLGFRWQDSPPWRCLLQYLADCASQSFDATRYRLVTAQVEQLVAATLLAAQPHDLGGCQLPRCTAVLPRHIRRVEEYLREHVGEPVCADQLAMIAGVSLRSLYAGFRDHCGVSPLQYLRNLRLDRARQALLDEPDSNIACVALRWGFGHLGRFSADYRKRFGESPSQSVRRLT